MLLAVAMIIPKSHQIPIETEEEEILDTQGFEYGRSNEYKDFLDNFYRYYLQKSRSEPERLKRYTQDNEDEYLEDSLDRVTRDNGRNFNPIIENSNTNGRGDFQDFRQFQSNLNKNQDSKGGPEFRFIREADESEVKKSRNTRDLGDKFSPTIQNSRGENIMRPDFNDYRKFQADLNRRDQLRNQQPKTKRSLDLEEVSKELSRVKRMLMFRPLFVYKNQEYKRKRIVKKVPKTV